MRTCPYCETELEGTSLAGKEADACPGCGGLWLAGETLTLAVKEHAKDLAPLDDRFPDHGEKPSLAHGAPTCADCGNLLEDRTFPVAPHLGMLACRHCKKLFLRDGQLRELHAIVSPATLPPKPEEVRAAAESASRFERDAAAYQATQYQPSTHLESGDGLWPARRQNQPWASWFVLGMPFWMVLLVILVGAMFVGLQVGMVFGAVGSEDAAVLEDLIGASAPGMGFLIGGTAFLVFWPVQAFFLSLLLLITWFFGEGGSDLSFGQMYVLLLKVVAFSSLFQSLFGLLLLAGLPALFVQVPSLVIRVVLYRQVLELEWREVWIMSVAGTFLCGLGSL